MTDLIDSLKEQAELSDWPTDELLMKAATALEALEGEEQRPHRPVGCNLADCGALYGPPFGVGNCTRRDCPLASRARPAQSEPDQNDGERYTIAKLTNIPANNLWTVLRCGVIWDPELRVEHESAQTIATALQERDRLRDAGQLVLDYHPVGTNPWIDEAYQVFREILRLAPRAKAALASKEPGDAK